jgi:hypothetical protein
MTIKFAADTAAVNGINLELVRQTQGLAVKIGGNTAAVNGMCMEVKPPSYVW